MTDTPTPPTERAPQPVAQPLAPIGESERIATLDVLRGVAILGIFLVNLTFFAFPMMEGVFPDHAALNTGDGLAWAFVKTFCEMKFVSMFSMLFGAGMVVLLTRTTARGQSFVGLYVRRLLILLGFGAIHAWGFWFGDILVFYAVLGFILLAMRNLSARTLAIVGVALLVLNFVVTTGCAGLNMLSLSAQPELTASDPPPTGWDAIVAARGQPLHPDWINAETVAYRDGPYIDALVFRLVTWCMMVVFTMLGFMQRVFGMFLIGAALMKSGFFAADGRGKAVRLALLLVPGLILELGATTLLWTAGNTVDARMILSGGMHDLGASCLALGYVGLIATICAAGAPLLLAPVAKVGRMALTCYLGETLIATFVFYHWGLGKFGSFGRLELLGFAAVVYALLLVFATVWLRFFRMGPLEWVWRTLTYMKPQPLRRTG